MKKKLLFLGVMAVLLTVAAGCSKQKTCRCSTKETTSGRWSRVRIVKIDKGECSQLHVFQGHDEVDSIWADSLLCTDYEFTIDSIFE